VHVFQGETGKISLGNSETKTGIKNVEKKRSPLLRRDSSEGTGNKGSDYRGGKRDQRRNYRFKNIGL
jgi:hypothetical protein